MNASKGKLKIEGDQASLDKILRMAYGGKMEGDTAEGVVEGPSHEQGGVPAVQAGSGEQVAEIEGGERIFSTEDTGAIEQAAQEIHKLMETGDNAAAEDMAMRLGFAVVDMIFAQDQSQAEQEAAMQEEQMAGMNSFGEEEDGEEAGFTV